MVGFKTLENTSLLDIVNAFNAAFSDYIVPMKMTEVSLMGKMKSEDIHLEYSVGAFDGDEMVGIILHGRRFVNQRPLLYNGGTGVVPAYRGQGITRKMYDFILPTMHNAKTQSVQLEVITENFPAIKAYEKIGFQTCRKVQCYQGNILPLETNNSAVTYQLMDQLPVDHIAGWTSVMPTWQNDFPALEHLYGTLKIWGAYDGESIVGVIAWNPLTRRIQHISVSPNDRNRGIGSGLLAQILEDGEGSCGIINVDMSNESFHHFLVRRGLEPSVSQYEMVLTLD